MGRPQTDPSGPSPYPPTQQQGQSITGPLPPTHVYPPPQTPPQQQLQYPPADASPMPLSPHKPPNVAPQGNVVAGVPTTVFQSNVPAISYPPSPSPQATGANMGVTGAHFSTNGPNMGAGGANFGSNGTNMVANGDNFNMKVNGGNAAANMGMNANGGNNFVGTVPWTTGLFGCMEDLSNAISTTLFPCVTFGQIAEIIDEGHTTCCTSGTIYLCMFCKLSQGYRKKLRMKYGLIEAPASDWMAHSLFEWCALCQEYRELANRGLHPALGWHGNMNAGQQMQGNQFTMVAPMNQTMN